MAESSAVRLAPREDDLDALTDVHEHLRVISELVQRHVPEARRAAYRTKIDAIVRRTTDPTLRLAVVGEFSSGKSTFINALLRTRLLKAACIATTASVTRIRKGTTLRITTIFTDGRSITATAEDHDALRRTVVALQPAAASDESLEDLLDRLTSDPVVADRVRDLEIVVPSERLDDDLVILDTPGINAGASLAQNHAQLTRRVLSESADCALVLTSASSAMSRTLIEFLDSHARPFLHRCIFVITAVDRQDESERAEVCERVRATLQDKFGLESPTILESAAITMLPTAVIPAARRDSWPRWQSEFVVLESTILAALRRERTLIIAEHLIRLLQDLVADMDRELAQAATALDEEERVLRENGVASIGQVLDSLYSRAVLELGTQGQHARLEVLNQRGNYTAAAQQYVMGLLARAGSNVRQYTHHVHPGVAGAVQHYGRHYTAAMNRALDELRSSSVLLVKELARQLEISHRELPTTVAKVSVPAVAIAPFPDPPAFRSTLALSGNVRPDATGSAAAVRALAWMGGVVGLIAGFQGGDGCGEAFILSIFGSLFGAGAGAVGGVILGAILGTGSSLQGHMRQLGTHLVAEIDTFFGELQRAFDAHIAAALRGVTDSFMTAIAQHKAQYGAALERLRTTHDEKQRAVAVLLATLRADATDLRRRAARLQSLRNRLARSRVPA